jgi:hypothetical protein
MSVCTRAAVLLLGLFGLTALVTAQARVPPISELVAWLDVPETQWVATAHLQTAPVDTVLPLPLHPGHLAFGPHDRWSAPMLAVAKLGEPAIPAVTSHIVALLGTADAASAAAARPLITVLGSMVNTTPWLDRGTKFPREAHSTARRWLPRLGGIPQAMTGR